MVLRSRRLLSLSMALVFCGASGLAQAERFVVKKIAIEGAQRVSRDAMLSYLGTNVGASFDTQRDGPAAVRALYATKEFDDIALFRDGATLVVSVKERPSIATISMSGNKKVDDAMLTSALKSVGIEAGLPFNPVTASAMSQELRRLYLDAGYYGVSTNVVEKPLERNRVDLSIEVEEGAPAVIRAVNIVGNTAFSDKQLLDLMESGTTINPFSSRNSYAKDKLEADLERIRSFYLDRGYLKFAIESSQVALSDDKRDIFVTINLAEGEVYTIDQIAVVGETVLPPSELRELMGLTAGETFSRKAVRESNQKIAEALGEEGFAFAQVAIEPTVDEVNKKVDLSFSIDSGKQSYVRRITFTGNTTTYDEVLRREMRLFEGGPFSPEKLKRSQTRLQRLGYVDRVNVDVQRVAGSEDLVDLVIGIEEGSVGSIQLNGGIDTNGDITLGASFDRDNIFGTGQRFQIGFEQSKVTDSFNVSLRDPYFTDEGISRTVRAYYRQTDVSEIDSAAAYINDTRGLSVGFGVPLSEFTRWNFSFGYEGNSLNTTDESNFQPGGIGRIIDGDPASGIEGQDDYQYLTAGLGLSYDTRDRVVFPENGHLHRLNFNASLPNDDAEFFQLGYDFEGYRELRENFIGAVRVGVDYGDAYGDGYSPQSLGTQPFFKRYYAGGIRSVRGFRSASLGPRDSDGDAVGGDFRTTASFSLVTPPPYSDPENSSVRLSFFYDIGNVFSDASDFDTEELRQSVGLGLIWRMPFGALTFSVAQPLNDEPEDNTQTFQFTIGTIY